MTTKVTTILVLSLFLSLACSFAVPALATTITPEPTSTPSTTVTPAPQCLVVTASKSLHLRRGPTVHSPALAWLYTGDELTELATVGSWYYVDTGTMTGYVNALYVEECE